MKGKIVNEGHSQTIFPHLTDSISSIGTLNISASALKILISKQIPVFFMSRNGLPKGNLSFSFSKNVFLRQKQFTMLSDSLKRFDIAKSIVVGKLSNQRRFLQRCENCVHGARKIGQRGVFGRTAVRKVPDS